MGAEPPAPVFGPPGGGEKGAEAGAWVAGFLLSPPQPLTSATDNNPKHNAIPRILRGPRSRSGFDTGRVRQRKARWSHSC